MGRVGPSPAEVGRAAAGWVRALLSYTDEPPMSEEAPMSDETPAIGLDGWSRAESDVIGRDEPAEG